MGGWSIVLAIINFLTSLPSLITKLQQMAADYREEQWKGKEQARKEKADQTAEKIKHAQDVGDEQAQEDALSDAIDDFNS